MRVTDTIPKIDKATYLFETLGWVKDGATFDEIRRSLIDLRLWLDQESIVNERRGASSTRQIKLSRNQDTLFWTNARESLRELMRLGLIAQTRLPSELKQLNVYRKVSFTLTEEGECYLELDDNDAPEFRRRFMQALEIAHPYIHGLRTALAKREFFFPRVQKYELPGDATSWKAGIPNPLSQLARDISKSVTTMVGLNIDPEDLENRMKAYLTLAWKRSDTELKANLYSKWVVKTINDTIVRVLVGHYAVPMDFVTFRSAISLLADLDAIWETRSLVGMKGWMVWSTSHGTPPAVTQPGLSPAAQSRLGPAWFNQIVLPVDEVKEKIVETFFSLGDSDRRGGFALIHTLRAKVCHVLKINGRSFDGILRMMHAGELSHLRYAINLDRGGGSELPPSEEPFRVGNRAYYLITFLMRN